MENVSGITVLGTGGERVELGSMWLHQPAVVVFVRHFG